MECASVRLTGVRTENGLCKSHSNSGLACCVHFGLNTLEKTTNASLLLPTMD